MAFYCPQLKWVTRDASGHTPSNVIPEADRDEVLLSMERNIKHVVLTLDRTATQRTGKDVPSMVTPGRCSLGLLRPLGVRAYLGLSRSEMMSIILADPH